LLASLALLLLAEPPAAHFHRVPEPRENAFSILVPADWRLSGGIVRVNPMNSGGALNAIGAKLDLTLENPGATVRLRWHPEMNYVDLRRTPVGQTGMFPPGSNYNGALVYPLPTAAQYLEALFLREHPAAASVQVVLRQPLPQTAASYQQVIQRMGIPVQFRFDASLLVVRYQEGGRGWESVLYSAVQDFGPAGGGLWSNKDTFTMRAPQGEMESLSPVVATILNSTQLNSAWVRGEIQGQIQRGEIAIRTQQDIARLDQEIADHRRRTNAEINNQAFHTLMGTDEYVNPLTKKVEVGSNAWNYRWVNDRGEAIYTNDGNYDPARAGLSGYVRSPVRKRFPEK